MHVPPEHLPFIFLTSCVGSAFLAIGILSWGFPLQLLVAFPFVGGMLYLITLTIIQKPWRGRKERLAARKRESTASLHE